MYLNTSIRGKVSLQTRSHDALSLSVGRRRPVEISRKVVSKKRRKECIVCQTVWPLSLSKLLETLGL